MNPHEAEEWCKKHPMKEVATIGAASYRFRWNSEIEKFETLRNNGEWFSEYCNKPSSFKCNFMPC